MTEPGSLHMAGDVVGATVVGVGVVTLSSALVVTKAGVAGVLEFPWAFAPNIVGETMQRNARKGTTSAVGLI